MCTSPSVCALGGPLDLLLDHVTPIKMPSPGTQHTNRIRVSGFETGEHEGGEAQGTAQGSGAGGEMGGRRVDYQSHEGVLP